MKQRGGTDVGAGSLRPYGWATPPLRIGTNRWSDLGQPTVNYWGGRLTCMVSPAAAGSENGALTSHTGPACPWLTTQRNGPLPKSFASTHQRWLPFSSSVPDQPSTA